MKISFYKLGLRSCCYSWSSLTKLRAATLGIKLSSLKVESCKGDFVEIVH